MHGIEKIKQISLREVEGGKDTRLFVINNTQPRGELIITVNSANRSQVVTIPATWVPVDLSLQSRSSEIIGSPDFRRAVARNFIILLDGDAAEDYINENNLAQTEIDRVLNRAGGQNFLAQNQNMSSNVGAGSRMKEILEANGSHAVPEAGQKTQDTVSGAVLQVVTRCNSDGEERLDEREGLGMLMGMNLSKADLKYIANNSQQSQLKEFAASKL